MLIHPTCSKVPWENLRGGTIPNAEALTVFFDISGNLAPVMHLPELKMFRNFLSLNRNGFRCPPELCGRLSEVMLKFQLAADLDFMINFFRLAELFTAISIDLPPLCSPESGQRRDDSEGAGIDAVYKYIIQRYDQDLTLDEVARIALMPPASFCRYFKRHTGHTFVSFLTNVRISAACKDLLSQKFESVNTVAYKCGFKSIPNFNRVFKRLTGFSPKAYIANHLNPIIALHPAG